MAHDVAIRAQGLWKRYGLPVPRLVQKGWSRLTGNPYDEDGGPWALRDVNIEVPRGEIVGIIGRNGAGKSTLLKVLAGVTTPTRGTVELVGRIFPMIELNAGLNPELTGRENVRLLAAIMGLAHGEIDEKLPDIEAFTELGDWFDRPVRTYSSGMLGRLGFGVAVNIHADIILVDETFAVGDLRFQNKSLARIRSLRESGATILLVSHSLETLQFVGRHGILMEQGRLLARGTILETVTAYETFVFRMEQTRLATRARSSFTLSDLEISGARLFGDDGETVSEVPAGMPFGVEIELELPRNRDNRRFTLGIYNAAGILCQANSSEPIAAAPGTAGGSYRLRAWYPANRLANGAYEIRFDVSHDKEGPASGQVGILGFSIIGPQRARGVIAGTAQWHLDSVETQPLPAASETPRPSAEDRMTEPGRISWSTLMRWRTECYQRFGAVGDLPVRSVHDELKVLLRPGLRVLDVGAGAHTPFRNAVEAAGAKYACLDADPSGTFDYRSFADVPTDASFDLVMANQVLEHLGVDDAFSMVKSAFEHLSDGGQIFATVPNAAHPVRQRDCTHITAWPANDLYSLLKSAGFEVTTLARYNKAPLTSNPIKRWLVTTICNEFRMDWCDSILAVGVKK